MDLRLVLLDRNAVNAVKKCVSGGKLESERRRELKKIDNRKNTISPILSIIEGQSGRKENAKELESTMRKESGYIGHFFKNAKTDSKYFSDAESINEFTKTFGNNTEHSWNDYTYFISSVGDILYQPIAKNKIRVEENNLFDLAKERGIKFSHPVFVAALATLYGHDGARKVIKPKKSYGSEEEKNKAAYNAASDLIVISRVANIRCVAKKLSGKTPNVIFFTFDKGLLSFSRGVYINSERALEGGGVEVNATYDRKLFPDLDDADWQRITNRLRSN